jgi:hypothetical protein
MTINAPQNHIMCERRIIIMESSVSSHDWIKSPWD